MKHLHPAWIALLVVVSIVTSAHAGGSFHLEDIRPLLKDSKEWREIEKKFVVDTTGEAVRFGRQWTDLGAGRCGPYQLSAKLKGEKGSSTYSIIIETYMTFLKDGKPITKDLETNADDFTESVVKITVAEDGKDAVDKHSAEAVVRNYFDRVNDRKEKEAYDCFSANFQKRKPFEKYASTFGDTKEVQLFTAKATDETKDSATVTVRLVVWDSKSVSSAWSGPLKLLKTEAGWRIDDMSGLIEK